jgi:hypothetical protein
MRKLLLVLAILVLIAIFLVYQGYIEAPRRSPSGGVEVKVNPPEVGTATVEVPMLRPKSSPPAGNTAAPAPAPAPAPQPAQPAPQPAPAPAP